MNGLRSLHGQYSLTKTMTFWGQIHSLVAVVLEYGGQLHYITRDDMGHECIVTTHMGG